MRFRLRHFAWVLLAVLTVTTAGCGKKDSQESKAKTEDPAAHAQTATAEASSSDEKKTSFKPFIVYKDKGSPNRFTPSGYMPNGECLKMEDAHTLMCHEGKTCIKVTYDIACSKKSRNWAGIYWLNPADNWGDRKGGYNLTGAERLTFWARGEKGGEQIEEFKAGGVGRGMDYPDTDNAFIGPVILTKEWKEYTIDLRGKDLSYISGGFAWVTNADVNPQECVFYLDDISYK
jgi:hypothetical protein